MSTAIKDYEFFKRYNPYYKKIISSEIFLRRPESGAISEPELAIIEQFLASLSNLARLEHLVELHSENLSRKSRAYANYLLAAILIKDRQNLRQAKKLVDEGLKSKFFLSNYLYLSGLLNLLSEHYSLAVHDLEQSIKVNPKDNGSHAVLALLLCCNGDFAQARNYAGVALGSGHELGGRLLKIIRSMSNFYLGEVETGGYDLSAINDPLLDSELAAIPSMTANFEYVDNESPILFVACDSQYLWKYAAALFLSAQELSFPSAFHFHLINPEDRDGELLSALKRRYPDSEIYVSFENVNFELFHRATYLSSIRFVRLFQLLQKTGRRFVVIDADALLKKQLEFSENDNLELVVFGPEKAPPWERIPAGVNVFRRSPETLRFCGAVASIIIRNVCSGEDNWFIDQIALSCAFEYFRGDFNISNLDSSKWFDQKEFSKESFFWFVTNEAKYQNNLFNYFKDFLLNHSGIDELIPKFNELVEVEGRPFLVNRNDVYIGRALKSGKRWCAHELELLKLVLEKGHVVVEAGANIGSHSVFLAEFVGPGGKLICLEPQRDIFHLLVSNIALNSLRNVECMNMAAGSVNSKLSMTRLLPWLPNNFGGLSLLEQDIDYSSNDFLAEYRDDVSVIAIDDLALDRCDLIKADVEGMELAVVSGAIDTICRHRPILYLECHPGEAAEALKDKLDELDYCGYFHGTRYDPNLLAIPREKVEVVWPKVKGNPALGAKLF